MAKTEKRGLSIPTLNHHDLKGRGLDFFDRYPEAGQGLVFWFPKAARIRNIIEEFWRREHYQRGYQIVFTPHIGDSALWYRGGHIQHFEDRMYAPMEVKKSRYKGIAYLVRPMNCPFHILMYLSQERYHDELPIRWAELGTVYRFEKQSDITGMIRVRGYTPDDAHIFCRRDQVEDEVIDVLQFAIHMLHTFGFNEEHYEFRLSVNPGVETVSPEDWQWAQRILRKAVKKIQRGGEVSPELGRSLFYGAKLDIEITDAKGHPWACSTVHIDTYLPKQFELTYHGKTRDEHPVIIHRTLLGSLERFVALLAEWYGGAFPVWLSPVQVRVIPVSEERHLDYAQGIKSKLDKAGLRTELDERKKTLQRKIRDAHLEKIKIPYILIVGDEEVKNATVSVRFRTEEDLGKWTLAKFIQAAKEVEDNKYLTLLPK